MSAVPVGEAVRNVQITMAKIACQTPIRPSDESIDPDDGDYISGSDAEPETAEDRSTSKPKG